MPAVCNDCNLARGKALRLLKGPEGYRDRPGLEA